MALYQNILVAYDGSENSQRALESARDLAQNLGNDCKLHIVTVWQKPVIYAYEGYSLQSFDQLVEDLERDAKAIAEKAMQQTESLGAQRTSVVLEGQAAAKIVEYADQNNIDLIVIGNRGHGGLKKLFLGSVSQQVVQEASTKVLIVK